MDVIERESRVHPLVGRRLPDGHLRIAPYEDWVARDAVQARQDGAGPHGVWAAIGPLRGLGVDLAGVFDLFDAAHDAGVMLGEVTIDQARPLDFDRDYVVAGEVTGVRRRRGVTVAVFDLIDLRVEVADDDGPVVTCTHTFVVPRAEA